MNMPFSLRRNWRRLLAALLAVLPVIAFLPFGVMWIWQQGWFSYWFTGAAILTGLGAVLSWLERRAVVTAAGHAAPAQATPPSPEWTPQDRGAWNEVQALAAQASGTILSSQQALLGTGMAVFEAVGQHYHPSSKHPLWEFTVPEVLLLSERISGRLRRSILEHTPLSERLRIGQILWFQQKITASQPVYKIGMGVFRIARLLNPVTALLAEMRAAFQGHVVEGLSAILLDRIARMYVEEVGRVAIDLYSGRLKADPGALLHPADMRDRLAPSAPPLPPLRLLAAGQVNAGKSSLVNALCGEVVAAVDVLPVPRGLAGYRLVRDGLPEVEIIDSAGLDQAEAVPALVEAAVKADLILWVCSAVRPARDIDRRALDALRAHFKTHSNLHQPPILVILSHVDQLRPFSHWQPPYNVREPDHPKAKTIRAAMESVAQALAVDIGAIVPARLDQGNLYNVDAVWTAVLTAMPEARKVQLLRVLRLASDDLSLNRLFVQMKNAGRWAFRLAGESDRGREVP